MGVRTPARTEGKKVEFVEMVLRFRVGLIFSVPIR